VALAIEEIEVANANRTGIVDVADVENTGRR